MKTLIELREENGLSQTDAAKKAGINKETWNKVENGVSKPQMRTLRKIAKAFDIPVSELKGGKPDKEKQADYVVEIKGFGEKGKEKLLNALKVEGNHLDSEEESKFIADYNDVACEQIKASYGVNEFVLNMVQNHANPIIKRRATWTEKNVYIHVGVFLSMLLGYVKDIDDQTDLIEDVLIMQPDWLNNYMNVIWMRNDGTGEDHLDRYYKIRAIKYAAEKWNENRESYRASNRSPFEVINALVTSKLANEYKGMRPYFETSEHSIDRLKKEISKEGVNND